MDNHIDVFVGEDIGQLHGAEETFEMALHRGIRVSGMILHGKSRTPAIAGMMVLGCPTNR